MGQESHSPLLCNANVGRNLNRVTVPILPETDSGTLTRAIVPGWRHRTDTYGVHVSGRAVSDVTVRQRIGAFHTVDGIRTVCCESLSRRIKT